MTNVSKGVATFIDPYSINRTLVVCLMQAGYLLTGCDRLGLLWLSVLAPSVRLGFAAPVRGISINGNRNIPRGAND